MEQDAKAVRVECDRCAGTGKMPTEWDLYSRLPSAFGTCHICLGTGWLLEKTLIYLTKYYDR